MIGWMRWTVPAALVLALAACADDDNPARCAAPGRTPALFVVNTLAETLTRFDLSARQVTCQTVTLGRVDAVAQPNAGVVHGDRLYVVNSGTNSVEVFSLPGLSRVGEVDCGAGANPYGIAIEGGHAFVTALLSGELLRVDLSSLAVTARVPAGVWPEGLAVASGRVFVANTGYAGSSGYLPGAVTVHDASTGAVEDTLFVGTNPQAVLVDSTGVVHVLCTGNYGDIQGRVFFVDPAVPAVVDSLDLGGSPGYAALADSGKVYVTGYFDGLMLYDGVGRVVRRGPEDPVAAAQGLSGLAFDPEERRLYAASFDEDGVRVFDTATGLEVSTFAAGDGPVACALYRP